MSPHLEIYDWRQTWFGSSIWTRITGGLFSGGLYAYAAAYLVAPLCGWHLESAVLASTMAGLPVAAKASLKFLVAWPFMYHSFNGVRHLVWDWALGFKKSQIYQTSWAVWGLSLGAAAGAVFLL